jgi:HEAT repeat protein
LPPSPPPPAVRDPDALETDSPELIKALFHTLGTTSFENDAADPSNDNKPPSEIDPITTNLSEHANKCINLLLDLMWNDRNPSVKAVATKSLGELKQGKAVYDWIIQHFTSDEPLKRVAALRNIASLGMIALIDVPAYLKMFTDDYGSVRIEACKVACVLKSPEREMINCLLDRLNDGDFKVRAYAIKALGRCNSKEPKNREALQYCITHDPHPACRTEGITIIYYHSN